ncbi:MAG: S4 domain-containing protein, partial [Candidatus Gastranaerophilaceae bacterium]
MAKEKKERLDKILFEKGFFETKSKAQAAVMAGNVKVNDQKITKAGFLIAPSENISISAEVL